MNNQRRKTIKEPVDLIRQAYDLLESVRDEEEECMDNMPENLQGTERYESMEAAVSDLEDVMDSLETAESTLEDL